MDIKNGDFSGVKVNCGDLDTCLGCLDSDISIKNTDNKRPGETLISCEATTSATTAQIRFTCDKNDNGKADEGLCLCPN